MSKEQKQQLDETVAAIQDRWGSAAVRRLSQVQRGAVPHVPTGFPALDKALVIGGLPLGRISEIVGIPTSGMSTVALKITARAQGQGGIAVYIDPGRNFDPDYAARCGLELNQLVLVHPQDGYQALAILQDFIAGGGIKALVFDVDSTLLKEARLAKALATTLDRLIAPLSRTECVLLFLTSLPTTAHPTLDSYPNTSVLPHHAAVRLFIQRERWLYKQRDIRGYQAQILVVKNKLGPAGNGVGVTIHFNGKVTLGADERE